MTRSNRAKRIFRQSKIVQSDLRTAAMRTHLRALAHVMGEVPAVKAMEAQWIGELERVYRVLVDSKTKCVEVICLGIDSVDNDVEGNYSDTSELPAWMQERLAVLSMMKVNPPQQKVEGVGMRIDENVFWVVKIEKHGVADYD